VKQKKSFADGEMVKEAFLEASDSLFDSFKNKSEIISAIKDVQLLRRTITLRAEEMNYDLIEQLTKDVNKCVCFSIKLNISKDILETSQLCIFIRMFFRDMSVKEE
jgi:hypothetical protein